MMNQYLQYMDAFNDTCKKLQTQKNTTRTPVHVHLFADKNLLPDITFNPLKSMYVVFRPKKNHSFIPNMIFNSTVLLSKCDIKYWRFILKNSLVTMKLQELRTLYIRSNALLRNIEKCNTDVKRELFRSYCTSFYCGHLWTSYNKTVLSKLRVAYNNIYRKLFKLLPQCSASLILAFYYICFCIVM